MCRIFGFRSILQSGVHRSLIDSDNAIIQQSARHPDGWGVAYYHMGSPHLIKIDNQAGECKIFEKVSGVVSSNTVVTHIRRSTVGPIGTLNTHPFQFGQWVFAHNGNVENFPEKREALLEKIAPNLRKFILGETDSEHLFYLLLTIFEKRGLLTQEIKNFDFLPILDEYLDLFRETLGQLSESKGDYHKNYLSFLLTNGKSMFAFNGGQPLFFSTHKNKCSERDTCDFFAKICEKKAKSHDKVHHLLVSSEIIKNENEWSSLKFGEFVGVDGDFVLQNGMGAF